MPASTSGEYEVAIIGLGPVGLTLANCLGTLGISTIAIDKQPAAYHLPRAVTFDDEVMRIFQSIDLVDEIQAITELGQDALFVDKDDQPLVRWARPPERTLNGWPVNHRFYQPQLEETLRAGALRFPEIAERRGCEVVGLIQDGNGVTLHCRDEGGEQTIRAAFVVGCDGGRSFTRGLISPGIEDLGFREEWVIVDLIMKEPDPNPDPYTYHYCGTPRMGSQVFAGSKRKRWEFRLNPDDDPEEIGKPEAIWNMLKRWITPEVAILERSTVYTFHSVLARTWRDRRVFIAGDAAHQTPPFMGQGMCAGLRDAANLGWKLERVLRRGGPDALLDTYQSERYPHVAEYINLTINLGQLINKTAEMVVSQNASAADDGSQHLSQLRPVLGPGISAGDEAQTGRLFPQPDFADGRKLDDGLGYKPALILRAGIGARLPSGLTQRFEAEGVVVIEPDTGVLEDWFAEAEAIAALMRPDRYVLGLARELSQLDDLIPSNWRYS